MGRIAAIGIGLVVMTWTTVEAQRRVELPARDAALRSRPTEVWTVGTDEGESWEMLANVTSMAFDRSDRLYVLDQGNHRVLVFDAAGKFLRQFGKQGGGPGEFQAPASLVVLSDGRLAVLDLGRRGFSLFSAEGEYERDLFLPEDLGMPRPSEVYALADGSVMARAMPVLRMGPGSGPPDLSGPQKSPVFRMTTEAKPATVTLHEFTMPAPTIRTSESGGRRMVMAMISPPVFEKQPTFAALPDRGVAISATTDYTIEIKGPDGRVARSLTRPLQPRKVTKADQDAARAERRRQLENVSRGSGMFVTSRGGSVSTGAPQLSQAQIEEQLSSLTFADVVPVIERVWSDPTGRLWVQRSAREPGGDPTIDLIGPGDRYAGTVSGVRMPAAVSASGLAAWTERDELDVEHVVVRRLPQDWK